MLAGAAVRHLAGGFGAGPLVGFKELHEIGEQDAGQAAIPTGGEMDANPRARGLSPQFCRPSPDT